MAAAAPSSSSASASAAAARPLVNVLSAADGSVTSSQLAMPGVLLAPIRSDVVHFVHTSMSKNHRQAYAVSPGAGHQHSAESWGTGRAVSRIPRVSGSGTHRAGQAAFGNMCRKGRMFAPTKTFRKWHRKINVNQRRYAVTSALAASALPALVMGRGHRIDEVAEVPLVVSADLEAVSQTAKAMALLKAVGAGPDLARARASRHIRSGRGKLRGRRHVVRRGPLLVYNEDRGVAHAFRNIPGVETVQVDRLNLLQLAPGGHVGRFVIWSEAAFARLDAVFGTLAKVSQSKADYRPPRPTVSTGDISRIINSDEVQSVLRPARLSRRDWKLKKNPLKNLGAMLRLNPYAMALRRQELLHQEAVAAAGGRKRKAAAAAAARTPAQARAAKQHTALKKKFYAEVLTGGTNYEN